jgi:hypothetical protein
MIVRYYDATKNVDGAFLPGVPLDDITEERWAELPKWLQLSVDASPFYRKTPPPRSAAATARSDGAEKE